MGSDFKNMFQNVQKIVFPQKNVRSEKNAPYLATLMEKYGNFWFYNTAMIEWPAIRNGDI